MMHPKRWQKKVPCTILKRTRATPGGRNQRLLSESGEICLAHGLAVDLDALSNGK
jgi:hypothetical protein